MPGYMLQGLTAAYFCMLLGLNLKTNKQRTIHIYIYIYIWYPPPPKTHASICSSLKSDRSASQFGHGRVLEIH